jgi:hypothetical protein
VQGDAAFILFGWMSNNTQTLTLMQGEQTHYLLQAKDRYPVQKMLLWVGKSAIAGRGLFTAQTIKRGRRIIQYLKVARNFASYSQPFVE